MLAPLQLLLLLLPLLLLWLLLLLLLAILFFLTRQTSAPQSVCKGSDTAPEVDELVLQFPNSRASAPHWNLWILLWVNLPLG